MLQDSHIELKHIPAKVDYINEFIAAESVCELLSVSGQAIK